MAKKQDNPRKINALSPNEFIKKYFGTLGLALTIRRYLLIVFIIQAFMLLVVLAFVSVLLQQREREVAKKGEVYAYWKKISQEFPDRPDILFNLAKSAYENGRKDEAEKYLDQAIKIDPLFKKAIELRDELIKK